jgi:hydroxymethylglutaryl-CoA lyase
VAQAAGVPVNVSLSCVFGCPMEGEVPVAVVMGWIDASRASASRASRCATPPAWPTRPQVQALCADALARQPALQITAHFHNTRAMGAVNTVAAIEAGIRRFDMSLGGIGGCPYAPGASGNVSTEDIVHMLDCMGYDTGIDVQSLIDAAGVLEALVQHPVAGAGVARGRAAEAASAAARLRSHRGTGPSACRRTGRGAGQQLSAMASRLGVTLWRLSRGS